ncbi:MFS transporter [Halosimplex aquaticum]|uniref:MFS transporter n=1 Tax=Halosimplex aquaticum TaxID=3026162 RepID=A0ABD5Y5M7_9EURY|nr:MFS transporter [Halosimplex aquaticum]
MSVRERLPARPVAKYYLYMATNTMGLALPIWVVFLRAQGLSYTEIMVLDAIWWLGLTAGEIPTGFVGDRIGWRNSLVLGNALRSVAVVAMGLSSTFWVLAAVYLLWAVGTTLQSGSTDAWLYELLERRIGDETFEHVRGRGESVTLAVGAVAAIAGGYVGDVSLRWPFYATGALWAAGTLVLVTFPSIAVDADDRVGPLEVLPLLRERILGSDLRRFVLWVGVLLGVAQAVSRFTQPVSVDLGVPVASLGWLYAGFTLLAALASARAEWIRERVGLDGWFLLTPALLGTLFVGAWVVPLVAIPGFVAIRAMRAVTRPLSKGYVNDRVATAGRATVLSGVSMAYSLIKLPFSVAGGVLADALSPLVAMAALGVGLLAVTLVVHRGGSPVGLRTGSEVGAD